jgi:poly(3-hydroxybutyrate) depolymerase
VEDENAHTDGHLRARPEKVTSAAPPGLQPLGFRAERDGYLYVPATYQKGRLTPLVVLLHGAGEDARDGLALLRGQSDEVGLILLALASRGPTWDLIVGRGSLSRTGRATDGSRSTAAAAGSYPSSSAPATR